VYTPPLDGRVRLVLVRGRVWYGRVWYGRRAKKKRTLVLRRFHAS